jgi:hypothetical protein
VYFIQDFKIRYLEDEIGSEDEIWIRSGQKESQFNYQWKIYQEQKRSKYSNFYIIFLSITIKFLPPVILLAELTGNIWALYRKKNLK